MKSNALRAGRPLVLFASLIFAGGALAQVASPKVVISNTSPVAEIALETGSNVEFAANGDLSIRCRKSGNDCVMANLGGGGGGTNPPTNLTLTPSTTTLTEGGAFSLQWSSSNAEACYAVSPSGVNGWSGRALATVQGSPGYPLTLTQGVYAFQMRCYNATGNSSVTSQTVTVQQGSGGGGGTGYCSEYYDGTTRPMPTGAQFNAHGFVKSETLFQTIWGVNPGAGGGPQVAVPGLFLNPTTQRYMSIPFVLTGTANQVTFNWIDSQGQGVPTGAVSVTISPCPGDFRPRSFNPPANDAYLSFSCGTNQAGISGSLSATPPGSGLAGCAAPLDKVMYLNIATYNMFTTTTPTASTCGASSFCGVNMAVQ